MVKKYKNCGNNILFVMCLLFASFCIIIYLINVSKNKDIPSGSKPLYIEDEEKCNQCKE